jgi:hypothetical protein
MADCKTRQSIPLSHVAISVAVGIDQHQTTPDSGSLAAALMMESRIAHI